MDTVWNLEHLEKADGPGHNSEEFRDSWCVFGGVLHFGVWGGKREAGANLGGAELVGPGVGGQEGGAEWELKS